MASRFVRPETTTLSISNGDSLIVKRRLSTGEQHDYFDRMYRRNPDGTYAIGTDNRLVVDSRRVSLATVAAYLVDWSLTDDQGKPVPIRGRSIDDVEAILGGLDPDDFKEISDAITAHEQTVEAARAAQKKILAGAPASPKTSPSPDAAVGAMSGSAI